jgi:two-component system alkaline phosphatase synthesis response regulator PhoP
MRLSVNESIFVLDDEPDILELVTLNLVRGGFKPRGFKRALDLLRALRETRPDLFILDLMLPDGDGLELCRKLKRDEPTRRVPVILLTARRDETDKVLGLELGADDYVTKPFSPKELVARVKAVLRRGREVEAGDVIAIGAGIELDLERRELKDAAGAVIELTKTEFDILAFLARQKGRVFPRAQLINGVWGDSVYVSDRNIDVHVRHLREKLGPAGDLIRNVRGVGYKLAE